MTAAAKLDLSLTRDFNAPPERVFDAWLDKSWGAWAGPKGVEGKVVQLDPKVGGRYRVVMHTPEGRMLTVGGTYRVIDRPKKLVLSWKWEHEDIDTLLTLTFAPNGAGTRLTLHHEGFAAEERRDGHRSGWGGTLDKLAAHLERAA